MSLPPCGDNWDCRVMPNTNELFPQTKHSQFQNISQSLFTSPNITEKKDGGGGLSPTYRYNGEKPLKLDKQTNKTIENQNKV